MRIHKQYLAGICRSIKVPIDKKVAIKNTQNNSIEIVSTLFKLNTLKVEFSFVKFFTYFYINITLITMDDDVNDVLAIGKFETF